MGKIEDCFGSIEAGQLYAVSAYEQPIMRLVVEKVETGSQTPDVRMQVIAGIAVATELTVPEAANITDPGLDIEPASVASFIASPRELREAAPLYNRYSIDVREKTALLLRGPLTEVGQVQPRVQELIDKKGGALTISRTPLVREAMVALRKSEYSNPYASNLLGLAKAALSNIW